LAEYATKFIHRRLSFDWDKVSGQNPFIPYLIREPIFFQNLIRTGLVVIEMIQVCCYKGCGIIYGEKEPLSDKQITHGLCPKHHEISLRELKAQMKELKNRIGGFKVLIVEDSTLFRQLLKETLRERFPSIEILEAVNGEEAFQEIETSRPDIIFMDIRLPGENGIELTKKVKARYPSIIVIILTGYDLPEYREFSSRYADYFFSKDSSTTENIFALVQSVSQGPV
jgi:CheY-like chemotaxis protein